MSDSHRDWPVRSADGHQAKLRIHGPAQAADGLLLVPAMGVAARHYDALASRLAASGVLVAVHEWRGIGSSSARASRQHDWGYRELLEIDLPASVDAACAGAPGVHWRIGGHSLGAQFAALLAAADARLQGIFIVASGVPYWRAYPHWQKVLLRGIFGFMNGLGAVSGYFPGRRTGFAGNESRGVIRDWTRTGRAGHYRVPGLSRDYEHALQTTCLPVLALRMAEDWYVPPASLDLLLAKLPLAQIERHELGRAALGGRRADHFGWMQHPGQVASLLIDWIASTNKEPTWPSRD
jgi:predicted alpha/beta hydrolase